MGRASIDAGILRRVRLQADRAAEAAHTRPKPEG